MFKIEKDSNTINMSELLQITPMDHIWMSLNSIVIYMIKKLLRIQCCKKLTLMKYYNRNIFEFKISG